jgi:hypothetical protein
MRQVKVVSEMVESFANRLQNVEDILKDNVNDFVGDFANSFSDRGMAGLECRMLESSLEMRKRAEVIRRDRSIALKLRIAKGQKSKGRQLCAVLFGQAVH